MSNKFTKNTVRIAIQKNGRLSEGSINFLKAYGICFELEGRRLIQSSYCGAVEILLLRSADIAQCVSEGIADFGIVGENVIEEKGLPVKKLRKLGFGECSLVIAVPKMPDLIRTTEDLNDKRIATSYPNLLSEYLKTNNLTSEIIEMSGSVEIAPKLNIADSICDLVQTGSTLKANGLKPFVEILKSQAVLIQSPVNNSFNNLFTCKLSIPNKTI